MTGKGTGIDDAMPGRKIGTVERAVARLRDDDPLDVLAEVGGLEIAALAGFIVGGAAARVPVVVDGADRRCRRRRRPRRSCPPRPAT